MPIRYCGDYAIRLRFDDSSDSYPCRIALKGRHVHAVVARQPRAIDEAGDTPVAYDGAAHAAMSFFSDDRDAFDGTRAELDGHGWVIRRRRLP